MTMNELPGSRGAGWHDKRNSFEADPQINICSKVIIPDNIY